MAGAGLHLMSSYPLSYPSSTPCTATALYWENLASCLIYKSNVWKNSIYSHREFIEGWLELRGNKLITGTEILEHSLYHTLSDAPDECLSTVFQFTKSLFNHIRILCYAIFLLYQCHIFFFFFAFKISNYLLFLLLHKNFPLISGCFSLLLFQFFFLMEPLYLWES